MPSQSKNAKLQFEVFYNNVSRIIGQRVRVQFSSHLFTVTVKDIQLAKLGDLINKPEMRKNDQGETYTPAVAVMRCKPMDGTDCNLYFIMEDVLRVNQRIEGIAISMDNGQEYVFTCLS